MRHLITKICKKISDKNLPFAILTLSIIFIIFYSPLFFEGKHFAPNGVNYFMNGGNAEREFPVRYKESDDLDVYTPYNKITHDRMRSGDFPMWTHLVGLGKPIVGDVFSILFDPFKLLGLVFENHFKAWDFRILMTNFLGMLFSFLLLRNIKISTIPSILGSVLFTSLFFYMPDTGIGVTRSWLVLLLYSIERSFKKDTGLNHFYVFLVTACTAFTGDLQMSMNSHITALIFIIMYSITFFRKNKEKGSLLFLYLPFFCGILVATINIFPAIENLSLSGRSLMFDYLDKDMFSFRDFFDWVWTYCGPFSIILFLFSVRSKVLLSRAMIVSLVLALLFSCNSYFNQFIRMIIPIMKNMQVSNYYLITPISVLIPFLIAIGTDEIIKILKTKVKNSVVIIFMSFVTISLLSPLYFSFYSSRDFFTEDKHTYPRPSCVKYLQKHMRAHRLFNLNQDRFAFSANFTSFYGINEVKYADSLVFKNKIDFFRTLAPNYKFYTEDVQLMIFPDPVSMIDKELFQLLDVEYLLAYKVITSSKFQLIHENYSDWCFNKMPGYKIYRSIEPAESYIQVKNITYGLDNNKVGNLMKDPLYKLNDRVYVSSGTGDESFTTGVISQFKRHGDKIEFHSSAKEATAVLIKTSYHQGWKGMINANENLEILKANMNFILVKIPAGANQIQLFYAPVIFTKAIYTAFFGLFFFIIFLLTRLKLKSKED